MKRALISTPATVSFCSPMLFSNGIFLPKITEGNASFGCNEDEIVSSDIIGTSFGSVFDPTQTQVVGKGDGHKGKIAK